MQSGLLAILCQNGCVYIYNTDIEQFVSCSIFSTRHKDAIGVEWIKGGSEKLLSLAIYGPLGITAWTLIRQVKDLVELPLETPI